MTGPGETRPPLHLASEPLAQLSAYRTKPDPAPVKLDANESPWPLPEDARRRLAERLADVPVHRYPDLLARDLKRALAERLGARPEELLLGVGSDEVIGVLMSAFGRAPGRVLYPTPTFVMYPITARVHGLEPVEVPLAPDWSLDVEATTRVIRHDTPNLIFLATPNNPTGNRFAPEALEAIVRAAPRSLVVLDEAYVAFAGESLGGWVDRHPNVGVMGTLSKVGLAGLRVGWIRMHEALVNEAEKARPPYNLNAYAQAAATALLTEMPELLDAQVEAIVAERSRLVELLTPRVERVHPSEANFVLVEVDDAAAVHAGLLERGVQVRRFANEPRLTACLRITVGTPEETDRLVEALDALSSATATL